MPPICFLTGASGFVGANLAPLLAARYRLRVLRRSGQELPGLHGIAHDCVDGTLQDPAALQAGVQGAEVVVHLAAMVSFRPEDRDAMFAINADATAALAAAARQAGVRRLLLDRYGIEIGGGLGAFAGKVWRIGCMGHTARPANVTLLLGALGEILR